MKKYSFVSAIRFIVITGVIIGLCPSLLAKPAEERSISDISLKTVKKNSNIQKVNKIISLVLELTIDKTTVLSGEPVNVSVKLTNSGSVSVEVYPEDASGELEFILRSKDGGINLLLSQTQDLRNKLNHRTPSLFEEFIDLPSGEYRVYQTDIAAYSNVAIPVGQYTLLARLEKGGMRFESKPVNINVEKINIQSVIVYSASSLNNISMISPHLNNKIQSVTIYYKESWLKMPYDGVFYQRNIFPSNKQINGLSGAVKYGISNHETWLAWLKGDVLEMQLGSKGKIYYTTDSIETSLQHTQLYPVGWQLSMPEAYFAVMGLDKQQHLTLSLIKNDEYSGKAIIYPVLLDIDKLPNRWKLKNIFGKDRNITSYLLLETIENGISKVEMLVLKPLEGVIVKRYTLPGITGKLEALSMNPISTWFEAELEAEDQEEVDVIADLLFKTNGKNPQMTFMRFSDKHEKPVIQHTFPLIKDKNNQLASHWTLSPAPLENPQAIAVLQDSIIAKKLTDDSPFVVLSEHSSGAKYLNLELMGKELWAIWVDPESGFEYIPVRP
ncbi:hypothetical protein MNBD_GAMMA10-1207 [hydrothermal vent metagenome]|uniref:Uncharacterized protein n=1 Tax=hydrothermal vent metagenome TaxID=652676 RepID=A0A3B0XZ34_9ZZZZ